MTRSPRDAALRRHLSVLRGRGTTVLREIAVGDTGTVIAVTILQTVVRLVGSIVLTRLLTAEAFGTVGLIASVAVVFGLISDIGIGAFVIRHKETLAPHFLDEIWTIRLIRSLALTVVIAALSRPIALYLGKPEMALPIAIGGLFFVIDGASSLAFATALRDGLLRRMQWLSLVSSLVGLLLSIALALLLRSFWAILVNNLISQVISVSFSYIFFPAAKRRWRLSLERWRELWGFARYITASTIITLIITQSDKVVFGRLFTLDQLGLYVLGGNLAGVASGLAYSWTGSVLYPRLAKAASQPTIELKRQFYRERLSFSLLYMLLIGGLIGSAPLVVALLYDPRYAGAGTFLRWLAFGGLFALNNQATNDLMIARGQPAYTLQTNLIRVAYLVLAGTIGYWRLGSTGVLAAVVTVELIAQIYGWGRLAADRLLSVRWEALLLAVAVGGFCLGELTSQLGFLLLGKSAP